MPARTRGFYRNFDEYGRETVVETFTCAHCNKVKRTTEKLPNGQEARGFCHKCMQPVCVECGGSERCDPFEKKLLRMEARGKLLKSMGIE